MCTELFSEFIYFRIHHSSSFWIIGASREHRRPGGLIMTWFILGGLFLQTWRETEVVSSSEATAAALRHDPPLLTDTDVLKFEHLNTSVHRCPHVKVCLQVLSVCYCCDIRPACRVQLDLVESSVIDEGTSWFLVRKQSQLFFPLWDSNSFGIFLWTTVPTWMKTNWLTYPVIVYLIKSKSLIESR